MSTNKNLFKEAIADAKAVREAALANAKAALEEALTPKLESMLAAKLQEMDYNQDDLEEIDYIQRSNDVSENDMYGEELEEDFDLSEILAELDAENQEMEYDLYEAMDEEGEDKSKESISDMSVEELKDLITDIIHSELENEEEETTEDEEAEEEHNDEDGVEMPDDEDEEVDLNELLAELDALDEVEEDESEQYEAKKKISKKSEDSKELKEAIRTINTLRNELNETNLLNAKLLYVNKIFKSKNLTESQKLKVIASFDKATTPKQAKQLFESIQDNLSTSKKSIVRESLGFASKPIGGAPRKQIIDTNDQFARWQKLANIK